MTPDLSIYLVTDAAQAARHGRDVVETVRRAVAGGVTTVQVREKAAPARDVLQLVERLGAELPPHVTLLVDDRVDVVLAARARGVRVDGVHVGQRDLPLADVRALLGQDAVVGVTAGAPHLLAAAERGPGRVDYVGLGVVHPTTSKADAPDPIGVAGAIALAASTDLPAVAIGGIRPADVGALRAGGLAGVAVVSWVCDAPDPYVATRELVEAWEAAA